MIKTQVQIPDELYERAKQVAAVKEWSFAEIVRRGLEYMTETNPPDRRPGTVWRLPGPYHLGPFLVPEDEWSELSHED